MLGLGKPIANSTWGKYRNLVCSLTNDDFIPAYARKVWGKELAAMMLTVSYLHANRIETLKSRAEWEGFPHAEAEKLAKKYIQTGGQVYAI